MGVTQQDIAKILGVTRVTVTRALNDSPLVATDMKTRIKALCEELGYHPHYSSRVLMSSATKVISAIRYDVRLHDLSARWVSQLQVETGAAGYMMRLDPASSFDRVYGERSADAFIVFGEPDLYIGYPRLYEAMMTDAVPIVVVDCPSFAIPKGSVSTDGAGGVEQVVTYLAQLGHRKMGYLGPAARGLGEERLAAFHTVTCTMGLETVDFCRNNWAADIDEVLGLADGLRWMVDQGVSCIVAASDLHAAGAIRLLRSWGKSVPDDISVTGYDDSLLSRAFDPPITTIRQDVDVASREAVSMVLEHIRTGEAQASKVVPTTLIPRGTTAKPILGAGSRQ